MTPLTGHGCGLRIGQNARFQASERVLAFAMAVLMVASALCGCGRPVTSPPVPTTVAGYQSLIVGRTFYGNGNAWLDDKQAARMQLRTDGSCLITAPPEPPQAGDSYLAFQDAFKGGGEGRWSVEQADDRFLLVIRKPDGTPWARGAIEYRQESGLPPMEVDSVRIDVRWELAIPADATTSGALNRTRWHSRGRDRPFK